MADLLPAPSISFSSRFPVRAEAPIRFHIIPFAGQAQGS
jgi:hypothetical protein